MIPESLLLVVAVVEAALIGVAAVVVLASAMRLALRARRRLACKALVIRDLVRAVELGGSASASEGVLGSAPSWLQSEVITELLPTVSGQRRTRLMSLAVECGMESEGERLCASRRWPRRLRGAHLLSLVGSGKETLAVMLDDDHREVRAQAAEGVGDNPTPDRLKRLLELLCDPEPLVRFAAKDALLRIGRPAALPLAELLGRVRGEEAVTALDVAAGLAGPEFLDPALALCTSDRPAVRARAAHLLGAIGGAQATEVLTRLLEDAEAKPRAAAAESLGRLGHWPASGGLAARLGDPDWSVRRAGALALRDLGAPGRLFLRRALGGEDRYARDIARQVLDLPDTADHSLAL